MNLFAILGFQLRSLFQEREMDVKLSTEIETHVVMTIEATHEHAGVRHAGAFAEDFRDADELAMR